MTDTEHLPGERERDFTGAATAVGDDRLAARLDRFKRRRIHPHRFERQVDRTFDMPFGKLPIFPRINEEDRAGVEQLLQRIDLNLNRATDVRDLGQHLRRRRRRQRIVGDRGGERLARNRVDSRPLFEHRQLVLGDPAQSPIVGFL